METPIAKMGDRAKSIDPLKLFSQEGIVVGVNPDGRVVVAINDDYHEFDPDKLVIYVAQEAEGVPVLEEDDESDEEEDQPWHWHFLGDPADWNDPDDTEAE